MKQVDDKFIKKYKITDIKKIVDDTYLVSFNVDFGFTESESFNKIFTSYKDIYEYFTYFYMEDCLIYRLNIIKQLKAKI